MIRGRIVLPDGVIDDGIVAVEGATIVAVEPYTGGSHEFVGTILPGLVDIHCHGGGGATFTTVDPTEAEAAAAHHHSRGTTTLLASLVTAPPADLEAQVGALRPLVAAGVLAGIHLEGPFLSAHRCGAQDPASLLDPDPALTARLLDAAGSTVRMMTIAPELPGYDAVATLLADNGVVVALGHSDADFDLFRRALHGEASVVTHLANGMPPIHHRSAGPVGAALVEAAAQNTFVELIADGVHVDAGFAALVFEIASRNVALITDAMAAAGMPDGTYALGPQRVTVEGGVARVGSGSIAGGTSNLLENVVRCTDAGVPLVEAVRAASATPARAIGLGDACGAIRPGLRADAVIVDDDLQLVDVMRGGKWFR